MSQNILIVGATSAIAEALARRYASQGNSLFLVARDIEKLKVIAGDLSVRGANAVNTFVMDFNNSEVILGMAEAAWDTLGSIDVALVAQGTLPDQLTAEEDVSYAVDQFRVNAESVIACLIALGSRFKAQGHGVIAVIGSVSGDRGRASNYLYGASKAAIEAFSSGLRARLFKYGVHVLLVKPGFVATPMTVALDFPDFLTASPLKVAIDIQRGIINRKDVLYTPWFWSLIMAAIRWVPMSMFKRLKI